MAEKKKMSVADILAAARKTDNKGEVAAETGATPATSPEAATGNEETAAAASSEVAASVEAAPAAKPKPAAGGARPSVADILKAAREAKGDAAPKAEAKPAEPKASPKPAAAKAAPKAPAAKADVAAAKGATGVKDTASILAAARKDHKPGPTTKSEATTKTSPALESKAKPGKPVVPPMPAKPSAAKPKAAAPAGEDRRMFLAFAIGSFFGMGCTGLAATVSLWTLGTARFMFPNVLVEPPSKFKVGFPSDFAPGMVEEKFKAQFGVWVVKAEYQGQMQIYALKTVCTHLGCTPNWLEGEQKFKCPCHGSGFYKDGINFEGPAPRPLERYAIHLSDDGQLEIDKSKVYQEEMGQWKEADCFVPV